MTCEPRAQAKQPIVAGRHCQPALDGLARSIGGRSRARLGQIAEQRGIGPHRIDGTRQPRGRRGRLAGTSTTRRSAAQLARCLGRRRGEHGVAHERITRAPGVGPGFSHGQVLNVSGSTGSFVDASRSERRPPATSPARSWARP
jgi:hypothetical protein